jgi:hypothetical protein
MDGCGDNRSFTLSNHSNYPEDRRGLAAEPLRATTAADLTKFLPQVGHYDVDLLNLTADRVLTVTNLG